MNHEVVVVGGGIGGLTTAALLAARGVNVCLFERQSRPGGCVANFEHMGYQFEPTAGLYSGFGVGEVYEKIFAELPVKPPEVERLSPAYSVRLPDRTEVVVNGNRSRFEDELKLAFPECSAAAIAFYRRLTEIEKASTAGADEIAATLLIDCSIRFQRFVDVQLQTFLQHDSARCPLSLAAPALNTGSRGMWSIRGGAQSLADSLAESLKMSGGWLRLDSTVLRLAYATDGRPTGVDLLSGERVTATRAIVSNLTIWDTYGKLIGLGRTPKSISSQLKQLQGWGAYLMFLSMDASAAARLSSTRILALNDWQEPNVYSPEQSQFVFASASQWDPRAPEGKLAVTVSTFTPADEWFAFHENETAHEEQDQAMLEFIWTRLHTAMPELGDSIEVIETATPRTFYENTRRKFGMIGRPRSASEIMGSKIQTAQTIFPNVFLVGDTSGSGFGMAGVSQSAFNLADLLTRTSQCHAGDF
jgi:phytoene dehydrogenase-like protein